MTVLSRFEAALDGLREALDSGDNEAIASAEQELDSAYDALDAFNQLFG